VGPLCVIFNLVQRGKLLLLINLMDVKVRRWQILPLVVFLLFFYVAFGQNLIVNPSFEGTSLDPWTQDIGEWYLTASTYNGGNYSLYELCIVSLLHIHSSTVLIQLVQKNNNLLSLF